MNSSGLLPACVVAGLILLCATKASASLAADCTELGIAITQHSCFHSEFGPFKTVLATAGSDAVAATPNVDSVHTEYRVGLTGEYSVVTYTPARAGAWAVLLGQDVPLRVLAGKAEALPALLEQEGSTGCAALPVLHVFELEAATQYRLVFGPTPADKIVAVIEYIDDFLTENGRDADGDGFGSKAEVIVTPCRPPTGFAPNTRDCNDADPRISPAAVELCDGADQNCNGVVDDVGLVCRAGLGACRVEGKTACSAEGAAACSAMPSNEAPESCNGLDDDCNGKIDDAEGLCTEPDRPTCVRSGMSASCGCQLDLDCGQRTSGRVCNAARGVCEDGCSVLPGRNGCPEGEACNERTERCEDLPGAGGAGGVSSDTNDGQEGGSPSGDHPAASEGGDAAATPDGASPSETRGGCGCRVAGGRSSARLSALGGLLALTLALRRRRASARRLAAALIAGSLMGCGGRVQEVGGGGMASIPNEPQAGDTLGGAAFAGSATMAGAAGIEPGCRPSLGEEPIAHACSHTTHGPFVPVVVGGELPAPDVSDLHHTYEVQVVGPGGRLSYRAQRAGSHAFMSDAPLRLELSRAGRSLSVAPSIAVEGCGHLAWATVYELTPATVYELVLLETAPRFDVFVEHLGAFGSGAWGEACEGR